MEDEEPQIIDYLSMLDSLLLEYSNNTFVLNVYPYSDGFSNCQTPVQEQEQTPVTEENRNNPLLLQLICFLTYDY